MTSSLLGSWTAFFDTGAEAAATLTGLVMVAISVNVQRILSARHLPARAFAAVGTMVVVLIASLAALIPQPMQAFAVEMDMVAVIAWSLHLPTSRRYISGHIEAGRPRRERVFSIALAQAKVLPLTLGGVLLTLGHPAGVYCIAAALVIALVASVLDAWILLVEILR